MVSYFIPRGRFLIKAGNVRHVPTENDKKWSMFQQFRLTASPNYSTKSSDTKIIKNNVTGFELKPNIHTQHIDKHSTSDKSRSKSWYQWTKVFLQLAPVSFFMYGVLEWQYHKSKCEENNEPRRATSFQTKIYCSLPLRFISRCWGWLAGCYVPNCLRSMVYGTYSNMFNVNMSEALHSDFKDYNSLSEFFTRSLKPGVRPIDETATIVSPADGRVLHFGIVSSNSLIEQVKGVNYGMREFLGPLNWKDVATSNIDYAQAIKESKNKDSCIYQCVIYLAPGDYHRFHSPADWTPKMRRHFSGELLSVNPRIANWLPELFCINERALYLGSWDHGFFSYTAVGATNVGSIEIYMDEKLKTNCWQGLCFGADKKRGEYQELFLKNNKKFSKGEILGHFNMGSTIVLIFEAPKNFVFGIQAGDKVYVGQSLGSLS